MPWTLIYLEEFENWLDVQTEDLQDESLAYLGLLRDKGPTLGRPYADTLKGSKVANLKELRFSYKGAPIRILFAFDPKKQGIIILAGDKTGDRRWYDKNIPVAEQLFSEHLEKQKTEDAEKANLMKEQQEKQNDKA